MNDQKCDLCDERGNHLGEGYAFCGPHFDEAWAWKVALEDAETEARGGPIAQRCPRRDEMFQAGGDPTETPDEWRIREGLLRCNYCGSLHPDTFIEKLRSGWVVGPTDKSYKAYAGPEREKHSEEYDGHLGDMPAMKQEAKFYFQHLSEVQCHDFIDLLNAKAMKIGYPGHFYTRPFFIAP